MSADVPEGLPAQGTLADLSIAELLVRLDRTAFSGTLEVTALHRRNLIAIEAGRATKVQLAVPIERLGRLLVEQGLVEAPRVEAVATRQAATGGRLGELLVAAGAVEPAGIDQALTEQVRRRLLRLFLLPEAEWRLAAGTDLLPEWGAAPQGLDLLAVLAEGVRGSLSAEALEARMLDVLAGRTATVALGPDLARLRLTPQEQSACRYLARGTWGTTVFHAVPPEHRHTLLVAAYCLHVTGQIRYSATGERAAVASPPAAAWAPSLAAPATPAPSEPPPTARPTTDRPGKAADETADAADGATATPDRELERELLEVYEHLEERTYYELLGVARDAAPDVLKAAYLERVKRCHPDRAARLGLAEHREKLEAILLRVREAFETLNDPQARAKYDKGLEGAVETTPEQVGAMVDQALAAERAYQVAVMLERQHRLDEALRQADEALRLQPEQGEYACMSLWLQACRRPPRASVEDLVPKMTEAAARVPGHERAQMQAARLLQRSGRGKEAIEHFRRVLQRNPQNVEAAREVRLAEMRQARQHGGSPSAGGLFGRLFGKKDR